MPIKPPVRAQAPLATPAPPMPTGAPPTPPAAASALAEMALRLPVPDRALHDRLIVIGASTGGTEALRAVLASLPAQMPPILVVQHMPEMFTASFAKRLDGLCALTVKEAAHAERARPGTVYIAPGHSHLLVRRVPGGFQCELSAADPVNRHRPSVDVLFHAAAREVGRQCLGVMLTGMGKDGALGMLAMREAGAYNICQDQQSCVVWGMPREATLNGAANEVASLGEIAGRLIATLRGS
ncbi:MAG: CheB methylesterase domain-containing protein [Candidatus Dactylopiibacterium sp.]|nr:CheB methylesterase domain-containing protein [Candidatus Dactylopiibacterium sp.]